MIKIHNVYSLTSSENNKGCLHLAIRKVDHVMKKIQKRFKNLRNLFLQTFPRFSALSSILGNMLKLL